MIREGYRAARVSKRSVECEEPGTIFRRGPRGLYGDLRVCGEAQQKAAGPRKRCLALRYMPGSWIFAEAYTWLGYTSLR